MQVKTIDVRLLNRAQVEAMSPGPDELIEVIASGLRARGRGEVVQPPDGQLAPDFPGRLSPWVRRPRPIA